jgi:hypothetical protein
VKTCNLNGNLNGGQWLILMFCEDVGSDSVCLFQVGEARRIS